MNFKLKIVVVAQIAVVCSFSSLRAGSVARLDLSRHLKSDKVNIAEIAKNTYEWTLADGKKQTLHLDLSASGIDLNKYDEFRFEIKPLGSQVALATQIQGFPSKDDVTSWYLKFKTTTGKFAEGRYDLRVDDDGVYLKCDQNIPSNTFVMSLARRILGVPNEVKWRKAIIRNPRFIRYPVKVAFNLLDTEIQEKNDEILYTYKLTLTNQTSENHTVSVDPDPEGRLKYFSVNAPKEVGVEAGKSTRIKITVGVSKMTALSLPPLYSERIYPTFSIKGVADSDVVPLMGYRRWPLWGTVPIFNRVEWSPVTMRAYLDARKEVLPAIDTWEKWVLRGADRSLQYDWPIPKDILPAHSQLYRAKGSHSYLRPLTPISIHKHKDPDSGRIFENVDIFDRSYVQRYYNLLANHVYECSIAYLLTSESKYFDKALKILIDLADAYDQIPCEGMRSTSGGSKLGCNTLLGSYVMPHLAEGFSFISNDPSLSQSDKKKIEMFLNKEAARLIRHSTEYSNQTAEHIRAYGSAGIATGFWPFAAEAVYGEFGWHEMVEYAYSEDGMGHEGGAYHRSIFGAMNELASFAYGQNVNLFTARFKRVYDGSLTAGIGGVEYETAYRVYRAPEFIPKLLEDRKKHAGTALALYGILGLPPLGDMKVFSSIMPTSGYIYLRKGNFENSMELRLNYSQPFDRTERDRFTTFLYANGKQIDDTTGRISYSSPYAHWMYATASHNSIVVDGEDEMDVDGSLIAYEPDPAFPAAIVATSKGNPFYKGVRQTRCVALLDDVYVVFDHVTSDKPHVIDRYQHGRGGKALFVPNTTITPKSTAYLPKYAHFKDLGKTVKTRTLDVVFKNNLKMRLVSDKEFSGYRVTGVSGYQARPAEITFARVENQKDVAFLAGFTFGVKSSLPELKIVKMDENAFVLEVKTNSGTYIVKGDVANKRVGVSLVSR